MSAKSVIRKGDTTDHGGVVINGFDNFTYEGVALAGIGSMVACPKCKGVFPIVQGTPYLDYGGTLVALEGMKTACGAALIASQSKYTIDSASTNSDEGHD